jgi:hypothetical protein
VHACIKAGAITGIFVPYYCSHIGSFQIKMHVMELVALLQNLQTPLTDSDRQQLKQRLEEHINFLITNDFNRLTQLLYTVDVDEQKLTLILAQQPGHDAAQIITDLILCRQEEKARSRAQFRAAPLVDEEERW